MPEYDDLLALFGGPKEEPPPVVEPEPPVVDDDDPELDEPPVVEPTPPVVTEPAIEPPVEDKAGRAFAEMRVNLTAYERALKAGAEAAGLPLDVFIKNMESAGLSKRAKEANTNPEIMQRLEQLEAEKQTRDTESVQQHLRSQFDGIKATMPWVGPAELQAFTAVLVSRQHDFQNLNANYEELYRGIYYKDVREKERQAALASRRNGTPSVPAPQGRGSGAVVTEAKTLAELGAILDQMPNK